MIALRRAHLTPSRAQPYHFGQVALLSSVEGTLT
jgi:hypothetical protein